MTGHVEDGGQMHSRNERGARGRWVLSFVVYLQSLLLSNVSLLSVSNASATGPWRAGKSVVVDNTNVDTVSRKRFIDVAKRCRAPVRAFLMDVTLEHAMHNELVRSPTPTCCTSHSVHHLIRVDQLIDINTCLLIIAIASIYKHEYSHMQFREIFDSKHSKINKMIFYSFRYVYYRTYGYVLIWYVLIHPYL